MLNIYKQFDYLEVCMKLQLMSLIRMQNITCVAVELGKSLSLVQPATAEITTFKNDADMNGNRTIKTV